MTSEHQRSRAPIVLIIDDQEWSSRSLESVLAPDGFAVTRAYTAAQGRQRALTHIPDAIFVSIQLPDADGISLCRSLRELPEIGAATPILLTCPDRPTRTQRLDAARAGVWDIVAYPVDTEELVLKLDAFVQAKLAADRLRDEGLVDPLTGLYNLSGLEQRSRELASWAYRTHEALACVVFSPKAGEDAEPADVRDMVAALRRSGRISDVIGRLGKTEVAVLAPSTDGFGAQRLAERLAEAIRTTGPVPGGTDIRAGFDAVENVREFPAAAKELLIRATMALRKARANGGPWLVPFDEGGRIH
jgi:PleD family two-component response regulator